VPCAGGLHLSALLEGREPSSDVDVADRARSRGVAVFPLSPYFIDAEPRAGLLFGYGAIPLERIPEGLARVRESL
jgi:GntR family transcriptional regulator/MocR family aminotransferase